MWSWISMNSKLFSYFGFAIKSRNIVFGYDNLVKCKSKNVLIVFDNTVNDKMQSKINRLARAHNWDIVKLECTLLSILGRNCKIVGITDENLANAIKQNI